MADEDILWRAEVDDRTLEFFQRFDANLDRIANTAEEGFDQVDSSIKQSGVQIGVLGGLVAGLTTQLVNMGLQAVQSIKGYIQEATQLRARVDVLGTTLDLVGRNAGYSAEQIAEAEEAVKSMGITTQAARQSLLRLTRANIDWSEASKLARIAQDAAVVAGIDSSQAFNRLILGIQKQEPELLDELGIQLRRTDAYKRLADELGTTSKALDENQRRQAILNDIYRQAGVVAGAYEQAMGQVGKQVTSLPRHMEELQLAIGGAFQPVYQEQITFMTEKLKELREWVDANQDAFNAFGEQAARTLRLLFQIVDDLTSSIIRLSVSTADWIEKAGIGLAKLLSDMSDAEAEQRAHENVTLERFGQFISIIIGSVKAAVVALREIIAFAGETLAIIPVAVADLAGVGEADVGRLLDDMANRAKAFGGTVEEAFESGTVGAAKFFGLIKDEAPAVADAMDEVGAVADGMDEAAKKAAEAAETVNKALEELQQRLTEEAEDRARKAARKQIEDELRRSFRIEDIERNHQERLDRIVEQGAKGRRELDDGYEKDWLERTQQYRDNGIKIEEDYRKNLRQLEEDYNIEASELARQRDAIGLLRLQRRHEQELKEEREAVEERRAGNADAYREQIDDLKERLEEQQQALEDSISSQIKAAEDQRKKEYESLARQLERQRKIRELHEQWAEEDRQRALEKELEEMAEHFADLEGLTAEGLDNILSEWESYFGDLSALRNEFLELQSDIAEITTSISSFNFGDIQTMGATLPPGATVPVSPLSVNPYARPGGGVGSAIFGQAGQVSSLLAGGGNIPGSITPQVPRLPPASPSVSRDERTVTHKVEGLEPYMERLVVNALLEIERNR